MPERIFGGRYQIVRHLARGGMAEVYLGQDELLSRPVAIKVLFPELARDDSFVERFRREARAAAGLNHHNIVAVFDFGEDDGAWYIVMEYVDGRTLRDIIRADGPMEPAQAIQVGAEIAAALAAAHAEGLVHRDVKPANVLIAGESVKVTDFGIARAADARQGLTMPGTVIGTATYLSPEQAQGRTVDHRSDLYSLGMVLYEMLTGKAPFAGGSPAAVVTRLTETPPAPSTVNPRVPRALDAVVMRAISIDPDDRQPSAERLRAELLAAAPATDDPGATVAIAPPPRVPEATAVVGQNPATTMLPPLAAELLSRPPGPEAYRRRQVAVIVLLAVVALGVIALLAVLAGDDDSGGGTATVPRVVGLTVGEATSAVEGAGLRVRLVEEERPGATADRVADQDPKPGDVVSTGTAVSLIVPRAPTTSSTGAGTTTPTTQVTTTTARPTTTLAPATTTATTATTIPVTTTVVSTTVATTTTT